MTPGHFDLRPVDVAGNARPTTVELHGDVDIANAAEFEEAVTKLLAAGPVILDLSPASYFDSAGFAMLDRLLGGGSLRLVMKPNCVLRKAAGIVGLPFDEQAGAAAAELASQEK